MKLKESPQINYSTTSDPTEARKWLESLPSLISCDFEAASRFTAEEKEAFKAELKENPPFARERELRQFINSSGLSHPSLVTITHLSIAYTENDAYVFIVDSQEMLTLIIDFLVTTPSKQIWHNLCFDGKLIYYHSKGLFPKNYEDTQIFAKTLLNHVNNTKSQTGLKHLMGYKYGDWAVSTDYFDISQMYNPDVHRYAAIDACATLTLWNELDAYTKD